MNRWENNPLHELFDSDPIFQCISKNSSLADWNRDGKYSMEQSSLLNAEPGQEIDVATAIRNAEDIQVKVDF